MEATITGEKEGRRGVGGMKNAFFFFLFDIFLDMLNQRMDFGTGTTIMWSKKLRYANN